MTRLQKIRNVFISIFMILSSLLFILDPEDSYVIIVTILGFALISYGIGNLAYFFSMARYMVGGKYILYKGVIFTDFGFLAFSINDVPRFYVLIYLMAINIFSGLVSVLRSTENKRIGSSWKLKFFHGVFDIFLAISCILFIEQNDTPVYIYSIGLIISAIMRIAQAFRPQQASSISSI